MIKTPTPSLVSFRGRNPSAATDVSQSNESNHPTRVKSNPPDSSLFFPPRHPWPYGVHSTVIERILSGGQFDGV